jgi:hypothetical protein
MKSGQNELIYPKDIDEKEAQIIELVAYNRKAPSEIAKKMSMCRNNVVKVIHKHRDLIISIQEEDKHKWKMKVDSLTRLAFNTYKDILKTDHRQPVLDGEGNVVGHEVNTQVLKTKKEVAEALLQNRDVLENNKQSGRSINIMQNNAPTKAQLKEIEEENAKKAQLEDHLSEYKGKVIEAKAS